MRVDTVLLSDESRPSWADATAKRPIRATIWNPDVAAGHPAPAVLLSHGTGGRATDLAWLAHALCEAGFVVASVDHHGNTSAEPEYLPEGFAFTWNRPRDLSMLLDHLLATGTVDANRVGAAGFSLGGYTVAALMGARLDPAILSAMTAGHIPLPPLPEFADLREALLARYSAAQLADFFLDAAGSRRDARIRSGFLMAPSIGQLIDPTSLGAVNVPVHIRWGEADDNAFPELNAHRYLAGIPHAIGCSVGADIGHYVFLNAAEDPSGVRDRTRAAALAFFAPLMDPAPSDATALRARPE